MKFSPILPALFILTAAICLTPQASDSIFASSCSGEAPKNARSCGGEASREFRTPVRSAVAKQPLRSVLKPKAKSCSGE